MKNTKRILACTLSAGLATGMMTGCYAKVKTEDYGKTVIATYGTKEVMLDEYNYYLKLMQTNYDSYYSFYSYYYGFKSLKDMYDSKPDQDRDITMWDSIKESAMTSLYQTYVLEDMADDYSVTLTDADNAKIKDTVKDFFDEGDSGIISAINVNEDRLTEILTRNAIAVKVYDKLVEDIDTNVNEADYRYVKVANIKITEAEKAEESTSADATAETTAASTVDLKAAAEKIMGEWKEATTADVTYDKAAETVVKKYAEDKEIKVAAMASSNYGKPEEDAKESLGKFSYENLKTGDFKVYEDGKTVYALYCVTDDEADSKKNAIDRELENRKSEMFKSKYPDIVKACPTWDYKSRVYSQISFAEIDYDEPTTAETTTAAETTKSDETTAETTTEAETTVEVTTEAETEGTSNDTVASQVVKAFEAEVNAGTAGTTDIAAKLAEADVFTDIGMGSMDVAEGLLNGFDAEITGFKSGTMFSPMIGSMPFVGYVFETDDAEALISNLEAHAQLNWNICTMADEMKSDVCGNYVLFVMAPTSFDAI